MVTTCLFRVPERPRLLLGGVTGLVSPPQSVQPRRSLAAARTALVGIDLGTSNSTVACLEEGRAVIVPAADGRRSTPSVVSLAEVTSERYSADGSLASNLQLQHSRQIRYACRLEWKPM